MRLLERSGSIVIDTEGYIVWSRGERDDSLTFGQVAKMTDDARGLFSDKTQ